MGITRRACANVPDHVMADYVFEGGKVRLLEPMTRSRYEREMLDRSAHRGRVMEIALEIQSSDAGLSMSP